MIGTVETHLNRYGDLTIEALPGIDWERLEGLPENEALAELLEYQTANGYEWIRPEEIAALTAAPILGWDVKRNQAGEVISTGAVYWFDNYQVEDAIKTLRAGDTLIFKRADETKG